MTAETQPRVPPAATSEPTPPKRPIDDPRAGQILASEHSSLLAGRSLVYNEAFTRTGMFLTFLSASLIVIGFVVASDRFSEAIIPITVLLLTVNLYNGLATAGRLIDASAEDLAAIRGMNRIRHAYSEVVPGIERYFVSSIHDDQRGVFSSYGSAATGPVSPLRNMIHGLTTQIGMVVVIDCVVFASLVTVVALGMGASLNPALGLGVAAFLVAFVASTYLGVRAAFRQSMFDDPMFPTPD